MPILSAHGRLTRAGECRWPLVPRFPCGFQVVIAAHNAAHWLSATLASIERTMRGQKWALVFGDDASTDDTLDITKAHQTGAEVAIIEPFPGKVQNVSHAKNEALRLGLPLRAEYPVILMMDADDLMHPARLSELVPPVLAGECEVAVGSHLFESIDPLGRTCIYSGREQVESGDFGFGPWATVFKADLVPRHGWLFIDRIPSHEDALLWCRWRANGVNIKGYDTPPVCTHYYRTGSVSAAADLTVRERDFRFFEAERKALADGRGPQSFCTVATADVLDEVELMLASLRIYHAQPVHVVCDEVVKAALDGRWPAVEFHVADMTSETRPSTWQASHHPHGPLMRKMEAMRRALAAHYTTMFLDADLIHLGPVTGRWRTDLAMAAHHYPDARQREANESWHGRWNSGMIFCQNPCFPDWWELAARRSTFTEQKCLDDIGRDFCITEMGPRYNLGFWRVGAGATPQENAEALGLTVTRAGVFIGDWQPLQSLHVHLWSEVPMYAGMRALTRWLLESSPVHDRLLAVVQEIEHRGGRHG